MSTVPRTPALPNRREISHDRHAAASEKPLCRVLWLGRRPYCTVWALQQRLAALRRAGQIPDTLLLLEHPPTVTLGRSASAHHVVATQEHLERLGVEVVESDRGGDVTYHGPGQLVGYPILNLRDTPHRADLHLYLRKLEETLLRALAQFGVAAGRVAMYTGVWTGTDTPVPRKIAAIGVKSSHWITQHGFALNVCPDLTAFGLIVPCGIQEFGVTSLSEILGHAVTVEETLPHVERSFAEVFALDCRRVE